MNHRYRFKQTLLMSGIGACLAFAANAQELLQTDGSEVGVAYTGKRTEEIALAASRANIDRIRRGTLRIAARPGAEITVEQVRHEFRFGTAIGNVNFRNPNTPASQRYLNLLKENFNAAVLENNMKWQVNEPRRGVEVYTAADLALEWCEANGFPLRGHTVFWGVPHQIQDWVKNLSDEELRAALKNRATSLLTRYKGRVRDWDVYNEMMHSNYFGRRLGPGIVAQMFAWCRAADPEARLFVNEYGILTGRDIDRYVSHISGLRARGIPVDGIGMQGHFGGRGLVNAAQVQDILDRLWNTFQLPMAITEFDVNDRNENVRAENLRKLYTVAFGHEGMEEITMWGFLEGHTWKRHTHLWNADGQPNAAGRMYRDLVYNQWWTRHKGRADATGILEIPAFYGDHVVTVDGKTFDVKLRKKKGRAEVDARPSAQQSTRTEKTRSTVEHMTASQKPSSNITLTVSHTNLDAFKPDPMIMRRDPSDIIHVDGRYYVWYTRGDKGIFHGYDSTLWYASSEDGLDWTEYGEALPRGDEGSWDEQSVFTPNILVAEGRYWLFYTGVPKPFNNDGNRVTKSAIGVAVADSPDGPWTRVSSEPVLSTSDNPEDFDSMRVDDTVMITRDGRYWLYYKGRQWDKSYLATKLGVAVADRPEGPYVKSEGNPVIPAGHEVMNWPLGTGVVALINYVGPEELRRTIQYAEDGVSFRKIGRARSVPFAAGFYRPEAFTDSGKGTWPEWGIQIKGTQGMMPTLNRFDCTWTASDPGN